MAKGKRGPALIELIHRQHAEGISEPTWIGGSGTAARSGTAEQDATGAREASATETRSEFDPPPGFIAVRGERVVLSFSSVSAGLAVFFLIIVVGASFLVGRRSGEKNGLRAGFQQGVASVQAGAVGEIEAARRAKPDTGIFDGIGTSPIVTAAESDADGDRLSPIAAAVPAQSAESGDSPWVQGHTYVVVQEFKAGDRTDAEAAQLFLRDHGVDTVILESSGNYRYRLVAAKGFNRDAPAQRKWCDEYHDRIKQLGRLFVKAGGRYDLQGYQKKLTGPGW